MQYASKMFSFVMLFFVELQFLCAYFGKKRKSISDFIFSPTRVSIDKKLSMFDQFISTLV